MFLPLHDLILVKPNEPKGTTDGGIVLPDCCKEDFGFGTVVKTGPGYWCESGELIAPCVNEGDEVMFYEGIGTAVTVGGQDMILLKDRDILMVNDEE